jgi:hypothetical protein
MSRQVVTAVFLAALLAAADPALAQRQRNPGGGGGGGDRGGGQVRGRQAVPPQDRGGSRPQAQRGERSRPYAAPPQASGPRDGAGTGRYAVPRDQAYANRGYTGRYIDPGYTARPGYGRPGYVPPRAGYAGPRGYVSPRVYVAPRGYYGARGYYGPPRYIAPGWRGGWAPGSRVLAPRFVSPFILGYGAWQPYYYRPSIGIGAYYGADGLYPFGAIPPAYYDPLPGGLYGGLRITDAPRDAQVFADGNYVGIVDDFDGVFQHLNLEPGQHRIEIHAPGFTPIAFDVVVQPGRTITLRADVY